MCCEILVVVARQLCDKGSSGKDDDQDWAATTSRIIQSAICLCATLPRVLIKLRASPGFGELA